MRFRVHHPTDAVPAVIAHHRATPAVREFLDRRTDVTQARAIAYDRNPRCTAGKCGGDDVTRFGARCADEHRGGRVTVIAAEQRGHVDVENVAVEQSLCSRWNA